MRQLQFLLIFKRKKKTKTNFGKNKKKLPSNCSAIIPLSKTKASKTAPIGRFYCMIIILYDL